MRSPFASAVLLLGLAAMLSSCTTNDDASTRAPSGVVEPGINDAYYANPDPDMWAGRFEVESREIWTRRAEIIDMVGVEDGDIVADVGAGTGFLTLALARRAYPEGRVIAVDIIPEFLEHIDERARGHAIMNVDLQLASETSVNLPAESVDTVFCCDTYHHFTAPAQTLASIHKALKPDGEFVMIDFIRDPRRSRPWILDHVRAGEETVFHEITAAGFDLIERPQFLEENYVLRFRKR